MASCRYLSTGYTLSCLDATPGVKNVYLANIDVMTGFTVSAANVITAIGMSGSSRFYRFQGPRFTASFDENINLSEENGCFSVTPEIKFKLLKRTTQLRDMLYIVGTSQLVAIVQNADDRYWLVGTTNSTSPSTDFGLTASEGKLSSGQKQDDFSGLELTLKGYTPVPAYEISSGIISGIVTS